MTTDAENVQAAARAARLADEPIELIRSGSNVLYRLPDGVVARLSQPGSEAGAGREAAVAEWLGYVGIDVVRPLAGVPQPTLTADERPVTWWHELPAHQPATPPELGKVLAKLHQLQVPTDPELSELDPFTKCRDRIVDTDGLISQADQDWLASVTSSTSSGNGKALLLTTQAGGVLSTATPGKATWPRPRTANWSCWTWNMLLLAQPSGT